MYSSYINHNLHDAIEREGNQIALQLMQNLEQANDIEDIELLQYTDDQPKIIDISMGFSPLPDVVPQSQLDSAQIAHNIPLYNQVANKLTLWQQLQANPQVLQWIEFGVNVPLETPIEPFFQQQTKIPTQQLDYWHDVLKPHYLQSGAIIQLPRKQQRYVSKCFMVPKSSGGFRLVIDLRNVNKHFTPTKVKFETLRNLRFAHRKLQLGITVDISDAYHHLRLHPDNAQYFQFEIDNELFQCVGLPFGWNASPAVFTKFVRCVLTWLRNPHIVNERIQKDILYTNIGTFYIQGFYITFWRQLQLWVYYPLSTIFCNFVQYYPCLSTLGKAFKSQPNAFFTQAIWYQFLQMNSNCRLPNLQSQNKNATIF